MRHALVTLAVFAALSAPAAAQTSTPPAKGPSIGFRAYGVVDANQMAASESFKALFGSAQTTGAGGGAEIDVWKHLFLRIAATRTTRSGSRVFVDNGTVYDLHIPFSVTMTPIEAGGGWRFASGGRLAPYIGGAFVSLAYEQVSDFAQASENVNERYTGGAAFGGVDVTIWKGLFVGGEAQYRHISVPDVSASVMHEFAETDLGGFTARIRIGFSTK
jgi:outer membrane protein with beta-barrel domain